MPETSRLPYEIQKDLYSRIELSFPEDRLELYL